MWDNGKLIEFLMQKFGIEWVKAAKIEKIDDGKTIRITNESNFLSLKLNDEKTNVNLEIDNGKTDKFIVKKKIYGKLSIYASQEANALNLRALEGIYRRLKQSYQKSGNYETSGEFYIQEKECKRKQLGFVGRHSWNIFYRGFCLYGERPYNVILVSLVTILMFATFYLFNGIEFTGASYINYDLNLNSFDFQKLTNIYLRDFILCVYTSVITFTTLGYGDVHPIGWSRLFASIESGIGIFMTALFIFVFSRRMIR